MGKSGEVSNSYSTVKRVFELSQPLHFYSITTSLMSFV